MDVKGWRTARENDAVDQVADEMSDQVAYEQALAEFRDALVEFVDEYEAANRMSGFASDGFVELAAMSCRLVSRNQLALELAERQVRPKRAITPCYAGIRIKKVAKQIFSVSREIT